MAFALILLSGLLFLVSGVMLLIAAFREGLLWGIACFFLPPVQLIFIVLHWDRCKTAVLTWLAGLLVLVVPVWMGGEEFAADLKTQLETYAPQQSLPAEWQEKLESMLPDSAKKELRRASAQLPETVKPKQTVYKCIDARKNVTYSEVPCPNQQSTEMKVSQ
ncbi:MAG: DUF4124 domain-containing protein [Pseudomonadales bacterium]|nr:DUF4124 domain-containing protein [Pseudomonadales bacterium]